MLGDEQAGAGVAEEAPPVGTAEERAAFDADDAAPATAAPATKPAPAAGAAAAAAAAPVKPGENSVGEELGEDGKPKAKATTAKEAAMAQAEEDKKAEQAELLRQETERIAAERLKDAPAAAEPLTKRLPGLVTKISTALKDVTFADPDDATKTLTFEQIAKDPAYAPVITIAAAIADVLSSERVAPVVESIESAAQSEARENLLADLEEGDATRPGIADIREIVIEGKAPEGKPSFWDYVDKDPALKALAESGKPKNVALAVAAYKEEVGIATVETDEAKAARTAAAAEAARQKKLHSGTARTTRSSAAPALSQTEVEKKAWDEEDEPKK